MGTAPMAAPARAGDTTGSDIQHDEAARARRGAADAAKLGRKNTRFTANGADQAENWRCSGAACRD